MKSLPRTPELGHRLNGKDAMTSRGHPGGIATGPRADIEDSARTLREKVEHGSKNGFGLQSFEAGYQIRRVGGVACEDSFVLHVPFSPFPLAELHPDLRFLYHGHFREDASGQFIYAASPMAG